MQTLSIDLTNDYQAAIDRTVAVLQRGGTAVFPTDTLYGLGCNALDASAVGRVFDIKHRSYVRALPMLVRDLSWARELAYISPDQERVLSAFWPGKVTFVFPRRAIVPGIMCGGGQTIGIRAPSHPFLQSLLQQLGYPLAGTSANLSGHEPTNDAKVIAESFAKAAPQPDLVLDAGVLPLTEPSTVVDLSGRQPRILRQGAIRADKIIPFL
ncbi:MAG TPA: L-threonylcarbamoyladenylate synthase [Candidatus Paceibacterota bacterium]|nr:L-threonylcarbamoyladenylate synthase [Candidatus Paceibacterota bacterium]